MPMGPHTYTHAHNAPTHNRTGGFRRLYIPGNLAFPQPLKAAAGRPSVPARSPVVFDVKLLYVPGELRVHFWVCIEEVSAITSKAVYSVSSIQPCAPHATNALLTSAPTFLYLYGC